MNKCLKAFTSVGLAVIFICLFITTSWASLFEINYYELRINLGAYAEIEGEVDRFDGDIPNYSSTNQVSDHRELCAWYDNYYDLLANRNAYANWTMGYELTDNGVSINSHMTLDTNYSYILDPDPGGIHNPGYAYAFAGPEQNGLLAEIMITPTAQMTAGTVIPFTIQTETSGTAWDVCDWVFNIAGVSVNQDNYDQAVLNLVVGEWYLFDFYTPYLGTQTQKIQNGHLESGFNFYLSKIQTPVPIPGAIWLLGSGLVGLIGLKRKYLH